MNVLEIRDTIIGYWNNTFKTVPTEYSNTPFPDHLRERPYVSLEIDFANAKTVITSTGTKTRHYGNIFITIRCPVGSGNKAAFTIANEVLNALERKRINGSTIVTRAGSIDDFTRPREQFGLLISVPFHTTC